MNISSADLVFPPGSLLLVTGASGFIGTHIVDQLILAGYIVRGTVRTEKQVIWTTKLFSERHGAGKFSAVIVPEMSLLGAFDEAVQGVKGIIHTASVVSFSADPNAVIPQTIAGVTSLLASAAKEPSVASFVYTSSSVAALQAGGPDSHLIIDDSTWNTAQIKEAWSVTSEPFPPTHPFAVYGASKAEAELALWSFVKDKKPNFQVNSILPDVNFGELLSLQGSLSTGGWVRTVFETGVGFVKDLPPVWYVDVDDTARLHVAALLSKSIKNERIYAFAHPFTWNDVLAVMRKSYPLREFPEDIPGLERSTLKVSTQKAEQILREVFGRDDWTSFEETIKKNLRGLI